MPSEREKRTDFTATAKVLHWLMAALIFIQLFLGWAFIQQVFDLLDGHGRMVALQWHKALGLSILALGLLRYWWRKTHVPPNFPPYIPQWERKVATYTELTIYSLFIVTPFIGWMIISTMPHPSTFLDLFTIPNFPVLPDLGNKKEIRAILVMAHRIMALSIVILVMLHIAAALKHHFIDRDGVLFRMTPRAMTGFLMKLRNIFGS